MFKINRCFLFFILFILFLPFISGSVADVVIEIEDDGLVKISGYTDNEDLKNLFETYSLTKKLDVFWYFDLNLSGLEKFYYVVVLPDNVEVNNFESINNTRLTIKNNKISIIGYDINNNLQISIRYSKVKPTFEFNYNSLIYFILFLIFILILLYYFLFVYNKKESLKRSLDYKNLNDRQKKIIYLLKKEGEISQNKLLLILKIPKSSLSRNLKSLESKGYIFRKKSGLSYLIKLK